MFSNAKHIHFIGIGGIGVSALARMALSRGAHVSGSDRSLSAITEELERLGVRMHPGHDEHHVPRIADLVVYSPAIAEENPELKRAKELHIATRSYPEVLGEISEESFTVAVSGTHGKTTTTAMIAHVLAKDVDPTVIVGSLLKGRASNFVEGHPRRFVVEACEYKRSFLNLHPDIAVITNIDADHLDYYRDLEDIKQAFREFVSRLPRTGHIVCDLDDADVRDVVKTANASIVNYRAYLDMVPELAVIGKHNLLNAAAALAVADIFGVDLQTAREKLKEFSGTWRRSEHKGTLSSGAEVYDDYGHHPTEVKATLKGFRERFPDKRITVLFQPHLYSRTKAHLGEFAESFEHADRLLLAPIYAAREVDDGSISHHHLARSARLLGHPFVESYNDARDVLPVLRDTLTGDDVFITLGAGDVYLVGEELLKQED